LRRGRKGVLLDDIRYLTERNQAMVVYHHQTRRKGGHEAELPYLANTLKEEGFRVSGALRAKPWSPRAFFILNGDEELSTRAQRVSGTWTNKIFWYSDQWLFPETPEADA